MNIEDDIKEAINKNLPSQVGDVLKRKLEEGDRLIEINKTLKQNTNVITKEYDKLKAKETLLNNAKIKLGDAIAKEKEVELREELIKLKEEHCEIRVADCKDIVSKVFANNRFKYQQYGNIPIGG